MIVISGVLVVLALVLLIAGVLADNLTLIYLSIATSAVSFLSLVFGVRQRKDEQLPGATSPAQSSAGAGVLAGAGDSGSRSTSSVALLERLEGPPAPERSAPAPVPGLGDTAAEAPAHRGSRRVDTPAAGAPQSPAAGGAVPAGAAHADTDRTDADEFDADESDGAQPVHAGDGYDDDEGHEARHEADDTHAVAVAPVEPAAPGDAAVEEYEYEYDDDYEAYEEEPSEGVVLVINGRPRYHVEGCRFVAGKDAEAIAVEDAREEGFTACGVCRPDEALAAAAAAYDEEYEDEAYEDEELGDEALADEAHTDAEPAPAEPVGAGLAGAGAGAGAGAERVSAAAGPRELGVVPGVTAVGRDETAAGAAGDRGLATGSAAGIQYGDGQDDDAEYDADYDDAEYEESEYGQPAYAEPGHAEPGHPEPGHAEPGHAEPAYAESEYDEVEDDEAYADEAAPTPPPAVPAPGAAGSDAYDTEVDQPAALAEHDDEVDEFDDVEDEALAAPEPPPVAPAAAAQPTPPAEPVTAPVPAPAPAPSRPRRVAAAAEAGVAAGAAESTGRARPSPSRRGALTRAGSTRPATGRRPVRGAAAEAAPSPVPESVPAPPPRTSTRGRVVVIPDRGRYHRPECRYVRESPDAVEITKNRATKQGYVACGVCKP